MATDNPQLAIDNRQLAILRPFDYAQGAQNFQVA